jgi:SAM-dependent methyltransferase
MGSDADAALIAGPAGHSTSHTGWNHNTLYHRVILEAVAADPRRAIDIRRGDGALTRARRALDVGCGEGALTRELRRVVPEVVGIDRDPATICSARAHPEASDIRYVEGDALTYPFEPCSFDLVTAVASLHHMDAETLLCRLRDPLRPAGVLAVVGLARSERTDLPIDVAAAVAHRMRRLRAPYWQHSSPTVSPPPETYPSMRRITARLLPGARFRRRLYWRYTVVWVKPPVG